MTQQQLLQAARETLVGGLNRDQRHCLRVAAAAHGRSAQQIAKASTMRLALWVSKGKSAI